MKIGDLVSWQVLGLQWTGILLRRIERHKNIDNDLWEIFTLGKVHIERRFHLEVILESR